MALPGKKKKKHEVSPLRKVPATVKTVPKNFSKFLEYNPNPIHNSYSLITWVNFNFLSFIAILKFLWQYYHIKKHN